MKHWKCHQEKEKKRKKWRTATTRFTHSCLLALLFRFTYSKTCISKGKHSQSQAFSIDHLSMQAVWPDTNVFASPLLHILYVCYYTGEHDPFYMDWLKTI